MPFVLWPAQRDVLARMDTERFLIFLKARQLGISWLACVSSLHRCMTRKGQVILMFSQGQGEADELTKRVRFLYANHANLGSLPMLATDNNSELEWSNGSRVISLPATKKAGRSWTASRVIMDEFAFMQYGPDVLAAVEPTVNDGGALWIISTADGQGTPYHQHWQQARAGKSRYKHVFLSWTANPRREPSFRANLLETALDKAKVKREYPENDEEAFIHASGLIYDVWSDGPEDGNVTEAADYIEGGGRVLWAVDDGYAGVLDPQTGHFTAPSHPRVFLWVQQRATGQLCVFAESYAVQLQDDAHLAEVLAMPYPKPEAAGIDKSAASLKGRLHHAGIATLSSPTSVEESIKAMRRYVAKDTNGLRMLLVHPRCTHFRYEMASYRRDETTQHPIKAHDHGPDAARYMCWPLRHEV